MTPSNRHLHLTALVSGVDPLRSGFLSSALFLSVSYIVPSGLILMTRAQVIDNLAEAEDRSSGLPPAGAQYVAD